MKTFVVMPHYLVTNELVELARNAITSFKKYSDAKIISVDDGSPIQEGIDMLHELSDVVITNKENSGFGVSCNNGFKWIFENEKDDCYIICANNDIEIYENSVKELENPFEMFPNVAFTGIISSRERIVEGRELQNMHWNQMTEGGFLGDRMQDGGLWCSTKSVLQKIGIFDEQFIRGGYEDIDIFLRARDTLGMKLVMNGNGWYWHKQGATRWGCQEAGKVNTFGYESKSIENENLQRFIKKWGYNPHSRQIWFNKEIFNP